MADRASRGPDDLRAHVGRRAAGVAGRGRRCVAKWTRILAVRAAVQKELEDAAPARARSARRCRRRSRSSAPDADLRGAGVARRRPALRADHVGGARSSARATALAIAVTPSAHAEVRALLALARRRRRRSGASDAVRRAASPTSSAAASRAVRMSPTVDRRRAPTGASPRWWRWLWLSARRHRRRPARPRR